eukprot:6947015-Karenia_brevis.AAC.1
MEGFENAILLTPFNQAAWTYTNLETTAFARRQNKQLLWTKTEDTPPASWTQYFLDDEALAAQQAKWLHLNARR